MPLVCRSELSNGLFALWEISESETILGMLCTAGERTYAAGHFPAGSRRREWLAWHALLHETAPGAEVAYDSDGAPVLKNGGYIGVSHTKGYAAIVTGEKPCAVDIELRSRNFSAAAPRFLSEAERELWPEGQQDTAAGTVWCAKEALYKWARIPETDFLRDIRITAADPAKCTLQGTVRGHGITLHNRSTETLFIVYCLGEPLPAGNDPLKKFP